MSDDSESNVEALKELGFVGVFYEGWEEFKGVLEGLGV